MNKMARVCETKLRPGEEARGRKRRRREEEEEGVERRGARLVWLSKLPKLYHRPCVTSPRYLGYKVERGGRYRGIWAGPAGLGFAGLRQNGVGA